MDYGSSVSHWIVMMLLPHNREFPYRRHVLFGVSGITVFFAGITSGLPATSMSKRIGIAAVISVIVYYYSAWIIRLDLRFSRVHPRKIRFTSLLSFYLPLAMSALLLVASPWALQQTWLGTPDARCMYFLVTPLLLAASAGAHRSISRELWDI